MLRVLGGHAARSEWCGIDLPAARPKCIPPTRRGGSASSSESSTWSVGLATSRSASSPASRRAAAKRRHVARACLEELLPACHRVPFDLPQRLVDQRGQHRLGALGERFDATRVAVAPVTARQASSRVTPCQLPPRQSRRKASASASSAMRSDGGLGLGRERSVQRRG